MDRRHAALAIAVLAVVGDSREEPPPLFEGHEVLDLGLLALEGHETATWIVKGETQLPPEAEGATYGSSLGVVVDLAASDLKPQHVTLTARMCGNQTVLAEVTLPYVEDTGDTSAQQFYVGFLEGCAPGEPCEDALCIDASNHEESPVGVALEVQASLMSDDYTDYDSDPIDVPIVLSFDEEGG